MIKKGIIVILLGLLTVGCSPSTYDECLYEKAADCDNDICLTLAENLCSERHPYKQGKWKRVKIEEITVGETTINSGLKAQFIFSSPDFYTKFCLQNKEKKLEEVCISSVDYDVLGPITVSEIAKMHGVFSLFFEWSIKSSGYGLLDWHTTYSIYRATKER